MSCVCYDFASVHCIAALWSSVGKGLTSWLSFVMLNCIFVTFACGILGQVWYIIVSISDLCLLSYFKNPFSYMTTNFPPLLDYASFIRSADNALLTQKIAIERMYHVNIFAHKRASLVNNIIFSCD